MPAGPRVSVIVPVHAGAGFLRAALRSILNQTAEDFEVIDRTTALFESVWSGAECRTCKLRDLCPDPIGPAPERARRSRERGIELGRPRRLRR